MAIKYCDCICLNDVITNDNNKFKRESLRNDNTRKNRNNEKFNPWQRLYDNCTNSFIMKTVSRKIHRYKKLFHFK